LIATAGWPNKPDGSKFVYRAAVKTGVIFKDSKNKPAAKKFVAFMLDEANLTPYVEGSLGRWFPVTKNAQQSAFWKSDPHRLAVYNQFMAGLKRAGVEINRKLLADLAVNNPAAFGELAAVARQGA